MNIFYLDKDFTLNAQYHVDKHIVKMPTEVAQMLVDTVLTYTDIEPPLTKSGKKYKKLSKGGHNHPCTRYIRDTLENFKFGILYGKALCQEYSFRYNKIHFSENIIKWAENQIPLISNRFKSEKVTFPLAMPDYCKLLDPITSYRNYYNQEKNHLFSWKKRQVPIWIFPKHI